MRLNSEIYCQILVSPGIGATLQLFFDISVLMTLDLPVAITQELDQNDARYGQ